MSSVRLPPKKDLDSAYIVVANYISQEFGPQSVNVDQVHAITHAAFKHLKHRGDPSLEKWKRGRVPDGNQKEKLIAAVEAVLVSAKTPWEPTLNLESKIQKLFLDVMRGNVPPAKKLLKERLLLHAVVWKRNPEILREGRDLLNKILTNMFEEIEHKNLSENESFHLEMIIGDLLSLYPFLGPERGEVLNVPVQIDGEWQLVAYEVEQILLTPSWMGSPLEASGLKPKDNDAAPPLLLFKGTTYPTDRGFGLSLITDLNPAASVGSYAFRTGKKKIDAWLEKHAGKNKAIIFGKSLGGAQAWRTALYHPDKVEKVMAYGAPGLSLRDVKRWNRVLKNSPEHPEINVFCQKGDPVPYFERAVKKGFNYYQVLGEKSRKGVLAHADMYSTHERSIIIRMDKSEIAQKWRRVGLSCFRAVLSVLIFPIFILAHAAQTAVKKFVRLIDHHIIKKISSKKMKNIKETQA